MTRTSTIAPDSAAARQAARVVALNPGASTAEVAKLAGWSRNHAGAALTAARKAGLCDFLRMGKCNGWFSAEALEREKARRQLEARKRHEEQRREVYERCRLRKIDAQAEKSGSPPLSLTPQRVVRPAGTWERQAARLLRPASPFDMLVAA